MDRAAFALCVFVPDKEGRNPAVGLAYTMIQAVKEYNDSTASVISVAHEISCAGAYAIILFDDTYDQTYTRLKLRAEAQPGSYLEPCYGIPVAVIPDSPVTRSGFRDRVLISSVIHCLWSVKPLLWLHKTNLD